jgi:hypothetical protein
LELYDNAGNLIDSVDCSSGWVAGDNTTKQAMERIGSSWQTSENPGGTPKAINGEQKRKDSAENISPQAYATGIVFSEVLPSPEGADSEGEWIEIFNSNDFEINLSGWQITDVQGAVKIYTFPEGIKIKSREYLVISRPVTKITLNNDGDELKIIQPNGKVVDNIAYEAAKTGESYALIGKEWVWTTNLTPGAENAIPAPITQAEKETQKLNSEEKKLATVVSGLKEATEEKGGFLSPIFLALIIALFSGLLMLFLKKKVRPS